MDDKQSSGQLLKTLPLSDVEISAASDISAIETSDMNPKVEIADTVRKQEAAKRTQAHFLLLQDIQKGVQLKTTRNSKEPLV